MRINNGRTLENKSAASKLKLLKLADKLGNIAEACRIMGYSTNSYYRFKALFEQGGKDALILSEETLKRPSLRLDDEIIEKCREIALSYPEYGKSKAAAILRQQGLEIFDGGMQSTWERLGLDTFEKRRFAQLAATKADSVSSAWIRLQTAMIKCLIC